MFKILSRIKYHKWIMGFRECSQEIARNINSDLKGRNNS